MATRVLRRCGILAPLALSLAGLACSKDVRIGAVISESGAAAAYGERVKKGIVLAREEIDAAGGLKGRGRISVLFRDDATMPERGRHVVSELIARDGVRLFIGAVSSTVSLAIAPLCEENGVLMLSPSASSPALSRAGGYVFRIYPSDVGEGTSLARFAKDLGLERVVVFAQDTDYGRGLSEVFQAQYEGRFRQVVQTFLFPAGATDRFPALVARLAPLDPDGIYLVAYEEDTAALLVELRRAGVRAVVLASSAVTGDIVRLAGAAAENLVFPQITFDVESREPAVGGFVRAYRQRYGEDPDIYAAHGYDALKILVAAMKLAGSDDPNEVRLALGSIHDYEGAAGVTTFNNDGDVLRHPRILLIHGGETVAYDEFVEDGGSILDRS